MVGNECVNENLIIGLSVGLGGTVLIVLIAIIVALAVRRRYQYKYKYKYGDHRDSTP